MKKSVFENDIPRCSLMSPSDSKLTFMLPFERREKTKERKNEGEKKRKRERERKKSGL